MVVFSDAAACEFNVVAGRVTATQQGEQHEEILGL